MMEDNKTKTKEIVTTAVVLGAIAAGVTAVANADKAGENIRSAYDFVRGKK